MFCRWALTGGASFGACSFTAAPCLFRTDSCWRHRFQREQDSQCDCKRFDWGVCEDVARSEEDRDEEEGEGRQEEESEGEVREDEDEDEMVEGGAEKSDVAVTRHRFSKTNQPDPKLTVKQSSSKYTVSFQTRWHQKLPWLHVSPAVEGVLCFYCCTAFNSETSPLAKNADSAFISSGFKRCG